MLLVVGLVAVVVGNTVLQVRLNVWQRAFYDALEHRALPAFAHQLMVFAAVAGGLLALVVAQTWLQEVLKVRLREWLTRDLLDAWLAPKRAYLLGFAGPVGTNPDQLLHEDARHLAELSGDLASGLLQATLLLVTFVGVLCALSGQVVFGSGPDAFAIPGYMVWCALAFAGSGSWLTARLGRPLVGLNAERYAREADLRVGLVRVNDVADGMAVEKGERGERRALDRLVDAAVTVTRQLAGGAARLTWATSGYGWLGLVVPVLVAAPGYFGGGLSFGGLMMVVGAFNQVQQSLRWSVDNFSRIADWQATLWRVATFREALLGHGTKGAADRLDVVERPDGVLRIEDLTLTLAAGRAALDVAAVEVRPGEHLLVVGDPRSGKSTLFHALAGLWPWGRGRLVLPPRSEVMFLPQRPYMAPGTLRAALAHPAEPDSFAEANMHAALQGVGLGSFASSLDRAAHWDREVSFEEQRQLAVARVLLHSPRWVVLDEGAPRLDEETREQLMGLMKRELAGTAVVGFSRRTPSDYFYGRAVRLVRLPERDAERAKMSAAPKAG